ncbi:MAG: 4-hydroxy-tetrahydrodipicolinate synthase [Bacteroidales bacterium]|nr:4-hydroxy-tetrahydrodipicolinate synthase [Bacteroidales bacterium]
MKDMIFKGCGTALVTPFRGGEVDYEAYAALVDRQVEGGVDFLTALATTAETPTLYADEKLRLMQITSDHCGGLPIIAGCGSNSVSGTLANMELLKGCCFDAYLVVVPFYNKPTQEGMYLYFKEIAARADKAVIMYNVPGRTGANMTAATCLRIARDCPNVVGIKEASGKLEQVLEEIAGAPDGFAILSGDDDMTFDIIKGGGHGVISVASNLLPGKVSEMTSAALAGDFGRASELDNALKPLYKACFVESNPIPVKAGMECLGLCTAQVRLPLTEAVAGTRDLMKETLAAL